MPLEYVGVESGRYFLENDPKLALTEGSHGKTVAVSYGNGLGPDMGLSPDSTHTQTGGRVTMSGQYFGMTPGQGQESTSNSYGKHVAVSMGHVHDNMAGPNLAVSPDASGTQTGGKKSNKFLSFFKFNKSKKNNNSRKARKSKDRKEKKEKKKNKK
jgi:hypothetical protein